MIRSGLSTSISFSTPRVVGTAVFDEDDLVAQAGRFQDRDQPIDEPPQRLSGTIYRNDHGKIKIVAHEFRLGPGDVFFGEAERSSPKMIAAFDFVEAVAESLVQPNGGRVVELGDDPRSRRTQVRHSSVRGVDQERADSLTASMWAYGD